MLCENYKKRQLFKNVNQTLIDSYFINPNIMGNNPYKSSKTFRREITNESDFINKSIIVKIGNLEEVKETDNGAKNFIDKFAGSLTGSFHPTKTAKEMKQEALKKDIQEGKI